MERTFPEKFNGTQYKLENILILRLAIFIIFLFLYFYFFNVKEIGFPPSPDPVLSFLSETIEISIGILSIILVFILPPVLCTLFSWKTIGKVISHRRKRYEDQRLKSGNPAEKKIPGNISNRDSYKAHGDLKELSERGKESYTAGNYQEAISIYSRAINLCSNNSAYFNRGIVYYKMGKRKKSVKDFKKAAKLGHEKSQYILTSIKVAW